MKQEDKDRFEAMMRACRRGDAFTQMRLVHDELALLAGAWSRNPLRHFVFGLVLAFAFQQLRVLADGPLLLDLVGLAALVWYAGRTVFENFRK